MFHNQPLMIVAPPRSGTTWISKVLSTDSSIQYIHEPDNDKNHFLGYLSKRDLCRFPFLNPDSSNSKYLAVFRHAATNKMFSTTSKLNRYLFKYHQLNPSKIEQQYDRQGVLRHAHKSGQWIYLLIKLFGDIPRIVSGRRLIKSVHSVLSLPLILSRLDIHPIYIFRHPAAVISSYLYMGMHDGNRLHTILENLKSNISPEQYTKAIRLKNELAQKGAQMGLFHSMMERIRKSYGIDVLFYENIIENPVQSFGEIFHKYNLHWNENTSKFLSESNKKGTGYRTERIADKQKYIWKERLNKDEIKKIEQGYSIFSNDLYTFE